MGIIHALMRHVLDLLAPGTGRRRAATCPAGPGLEPDPDTRWEDTACLPAHRSPYGLHTPLDGAANVMVRPYLVAVEREQAQRQRRRLALVLAADFGVDLDRHVVGAGTVT